MTEKHILIGLIGIAVTLGIALSAGILFVLPFIVLLLYCGKGL